jgi:O-antigen/teichoic acid export membrane protein
MEGVPATNLIGNEFGCWLPGLTTSNEPGFIYTHGPNILIASMMPSAAVGHYALATGLNRQINSVLTPVPQVIYPAATALHVRGDRQGLERLYHDGTRLMLLVMISVVLLAGFWADDFYRLWIGEKYLSGFPFQSVAVLFQILLISVVTSYSSNIACQILLGAGRVRTVATALLCGSALNLTTSFVLMHQFHYGLAGVAVAVVIASAAVDLIAMPLLLQRVVGLSALGVLRRSFLRPIAVGGLQATIYVSIRFAAGHPADWLHLAQQGLLAGTVALAALLAVGLTSAERTRFVTQPISRFWGSGKAVDAGGMLNKPI